MKLNNEITGHLMAFITILVWGTTFISTKILLIDFTPIEILFYRFMIGLIALTIAFPRRLKGTNIKQEVMFAAAGLCGVSLYFLFENIALTYTFASNVGVIISVAPFFTAIFSHWLLKDEKLKGTFFIGFIVSIAGIILINFNGSMILKLNPIGDLLALLAAIVWAMYSVLTRKISQYGHNTIQTTRRIFFYGLLLMLPMFLLFPFKWEFERFADSINLFNFLFLGLGASALCFVTWSIAIKSLGAIKTSIYIYILPGVTVIAAVLVLNEKITWMAALGTLLAVTGLFISERKSKMNTTQGMSEN